MFPSVFIPFSSIPLFRLVSSTAIIMPTLNIDPKKDIPNLAGKVIVITGGEHLTKEESVPDISHTKCHTYNPTNKQVPQAHAAAPSSNSPHTTQHTSSSRAATKKQPATSSPSPKDQASN